MFSKILIANRGEIACRIAATAQRMGIATVAVYSDADHAAKHVGACDAAVRLGPASARESYLLGARIIELARTCGAQAIHPGYGFLSENEEFARDCEIAGLVFIGPPASAIRAMGSKSAAKTLMGRAGVPLVPGYHGEDQDPALLAAEAQRIGYPVLIKASAGGGGKGMRVVAKSREFASALASCQREARTSFGDERVLIERYLQRPRHIEIQVFADRFGDALFLFERDCSVQRRHQKVLEEAPAPGMTVERRAAMGEAAVAAARAVGYVGAGTVEFIAETDGRFYFMEMNTRLQVEHPVTEMITGFDLVQWQFEIAAGAPLPARQAELSITGHAIEARIYAENPERGFLPSTGKLRRLAFPPAVEFARNAQYDTHADPAPVRIDSGVCEGDEITPWYDPMIAKLIVWGRDRGEALARMQRALAQCAIVGPSTNVAFLARVVASQSFVSGSLDTGLIEREGATLFPPPRRPPLAVQALAVGALLEAEREAENHDPWSKTHGWRLNHERIRMLELVAPAGTCEVGVVYGREGIELVIDDARWRPSIIATGPARFAVAVGDSRVAGDVVVDGENLHVFVDGEHWVLVWADPLAHAGEEPVNEGRLTAPMPGKVIAIHVTAGAHVLRGQPLLVMEAMKMEHTIHAPSDGTVVELKYAVGEQVAEGAQLITFAQPDADKGASS